MKQRTVDNLTPEESQEWLQHNDPDFGVLNVTGAISSPDARAERIKKVIKEYGLAHQSGTIRITIS